jgi:hypothetical protein
MFDLIAKLSGALLASYGRRLLFHPAGQMSLPR